MTSECDFFNKCELGFEFAMPISVVEAVYRGAISSATFGVGILALTAAPQVLTRFFRLKLPGYNAL